MESAADWPPLITRVPRKPKVAQFCAAPWPNFTPPLTLYGTSQRIAQMGVVQPGSPDVADEKRVARGIGQDGAAKFIWRHLAPLAADA